ncbi:hypothetical protein PGN_1956 [Porphyromonas gingivalis ATCC 33277]|uniref:DNA methylase n=1 Tax=Porphyromonas gingivalis (strain ATCC 33277 / DSM 20709 / CIP 103683 / JCM 12257 / NCTC 11834 / 2561) TaxID=431947 RepID=B2RM80_PORG3|nr:hypothetical protein PGN_1956 [Porphyromonas gingivalis ATCC 33277]
MLLKNNRQQSLSLAPFMRRTPLYSTSLFCKGLE